MRGTCPAVTFRLKGYNVRTTSATEFAKGPCRDVFDDDDVDVKLWGEIQSDGWVRATRIEFKK